MLEAMDGMSPDDLLHEENVAFGNLRGALLHNLGAHMGWLSICAGYDAWSRVPVRDMQSVDGFRALYDGAHALWSEFIESLSDEDVLAPAELPLDINFRNSAGAELVAWADEHSMRPRRAMWQSMLHVVNHSTQHRGEIGMALDAMGRSPGDLDYGTFEEYRAIRGDVWP
jgi:uncharacterized damage-inducible protein DinB